MQLTNLHPQFDLLHTKYGDPELRPIYGAGETNDPKIAFVFMNPTDKNVSSSPGWTGIRAPWIGTKNIWRLFSKLNLLNNASLLSRIQTIRPDEWTPEFAVQVYKEVAQNGMYITNISKATTKGAVPVPNSVYKEFRPLLLMELDQLRPEFVFTLGNQVSSTLLARSVAVSGYSGEQAEQLALPSGAVLRVYPAYYPVGQGQRNMPLTIERFKSVIG